MTAVVRLAPENYPLLVGDLLISSSVETKKVVSVPTVGPVSKIEDKYEGKSLDRPTGLRQKLSIIDENLIVGWAGTQFAARSVISNLREKQLHEPFTRETLFEHLGEVDSEYWNKYGLALVGFVRDSQGVAWFSRGHISYQVQTESYGRIAVLGSGTDDIKEYFTAMPTMPDASGPVNKAQHAANCGLLLSGTMLGRELGSADSLSKLYGGGFEIASQSGGRFEKLSNFSYVFWVAKISKDGVGIRPINVSKYSYHGDILIIRTARSTGVDDGENLRGEQTITMTPADYIVDPVYRKSKKNEIERIEWPSLDANWICNVFFVIGEGGAWATYTHITLAGDAEPPVRFHESTNGIDIDFRKEPFDKMMTKMHDEYWRLESE